MFSLAFARLSFRRCNSIRGKNWKIKTSSYDFWFKYSQIILINYDFKTQNFFSYGICYIIFHKFYYYFLKESNEHENKTQKLQNELFDIKKESHKRKKLLIAQQQIMHAGANSYHKVNNF